jgi:YVTN family beta-propeller protein
MKDDSDSYTSLAFAACAALAVGSGALMGLAGCGSDSNQGDDGPDPGQVALHESRSSTIALADDGSRVAMVNPDDGSLSVFATTDNARTSKIATGKNPSSVVITADGKSAFVANRADGTVVRVTGIDGGTPAIDATIAVGSEPVALALSPTGKKLFVAEFADSRVSVIDTATLQITQSMKLDRPRALLVTNNGDASDDDERLAVTQFYGTPVAGREAKDDGRTGTVRLYSLADLAQYKDITLAPIDAGFPRGGVAGAPSIQTSPNQLAALATAQGKLFITSVSASPEPPARFDNNVFPVVYTADLESAAQEGAVNLARKLVDANPTPTAANPRFLPGELSDIAFVNDSNVGYVVGRAGDVMIRVTFGATAEVGSTQNKQIDLAGNDSLGRCQNPIGLVIDTERQKAYVNCWITRRLGVVDLGAQSLVQTVEASAAPANAVEASVQRGKRFYFTGRGRWSNAGGNGAKGGEGWSSCGSCHPDGLSDNITWIFAAGPRQTTSQDGSFSHGPGAQKQRIFNWTGIFDEHHDFERNTRDVSGGLGAITTAPTVADCNQLDKETPVPLGGGLGKPVKENQDDPTTLCQHKDWDDIDNFVKTIQPVTKSRIADAAQVDRGRQLFVDGGCAKCHGGSGWTISRRMFTPALQTNTDLAAAAFVKPAFFPATWMYDNNGQNRTQISGQPAIGTADATGPAEPAAIGIAQIACTTRNVGTFGALDPSGTDALEIRPASGALVRAQGRAGYNVPSLYGLALGAPYLHHGQAPTLNDLFANTRWQFHTNAGNANMSVVLAQPGKLDDLVAFLLSIDATTPEIAVPNDPGTGLSFYVCP